MFTQAKILKVPQWKLRRIANRVLRVLDAHAGKSPIIRGYETSVRAAAERFVQKHSALAQQKSAVRALVQNGNLESEALLLATRGWLGLVARDVPTFNEQDFSERTRAPDDVIAFAQSLVDLVRGAAVPLACGEDLLSDLEGRLVGAREALSQGKRGLVSLQEMQAETREAATAFHAQLVPFRRSLRAVLGGSHRDYQELRSNRASRDDDEEASADQVAASDSSRAEVTQPVTTAQPPSEALASNGHS